MFCVFSSADRTAREAVHLLWRWWGEPGWTPIPRVQEPSALQTLTLTGGPGLPIARRPGDRDSADGA